MTDSGSDLSMEMIKELDIIYAPLTVHLDEKEYLDNIDMLPNRLYDEMREGKVPTTSQVSPKLFTDIFKDIAKNNESCIYIAFSSQLSGTYQTSVMVKNQVLEESPNLDLEIIDSKCASLGQGLAVYKAAKMAKEGKSKEEILKAIDFYIKHIEHIFTVDDLEYLFRGGRVSKTAAFLGGILNIKPLLDVEDGKLIPREKIRGRKKVLKRMIEIMGERGVNLENQSVFISHSDDLEGAMKLKELMEEEYGIKDFIINSIGCAIGAHVGPGTLSIFFLNEKE